MSAGKGYVDVSTIDPETSQKVAAAVRGKGALYLEAPVSGSKGPAEQGQLIFLTAGAHSKPCSNLLGFVRD
jgi:3-hydroxyisobutyrate dehydrogenase-like beta-hydroxyacid dehydrogenase